MKLLLDTHLLLWVAGEPQRLSDEALRLIGDDTHTLCFSAVSFWELAIKRSLGRDDFQVDTRRLKRLLLDNGYEEVPVLSEHTLALELLPPLHRDPFDRLLLAQAWHEGLRLLTSDAQLAHYPGPVQRV